MTNLQIDWRTKPRFDRALFDQLAEHTDDVGEIVAVYRQVLPVRRARMLRALAEADWGEARRLAHMAKSGAAMLGLLRLAALCETIEKAAAAGELDGSGLAAAIAEEFDAAGALVAEFGGE
jgi:HPt (histidine-containing phosphotransfer) domain-containing protein